MGAEKNVAVQESSASTEYTVKKDGAEVTAQEFYDAFMAGPVYLDAGAIEGTSTRGVAQVTIISWADSTGACTDSSDVVYVQAVATTGGDSVVVRIGESPNTKE